MTQNIKYIIGFIILLTIGYGALQWVRDYQYKHSAGYAASRYYDELQQRYQNDTYGGSTPEETLSLFIDALKKGDVDLASKYFEVKKQDEVLKSLENSSKQNKVSFILQEVTKAKLSKIENDKAYFVIIENGIVKTQIILNINSKEKWKIENL